MNHTGCFLLSQCSYLQTVLISVWRSDIFAKDAILFLLCLFLFEIHPRAGLTVASGETRNGAAQKYCHSYVTELSVVSSMRTVIISGFGIRFCSSLFATSVRPHAVIWLWINLTL